MGQREREGQTDREGEWGEKETDRERQTKTDRHRDRQAARQRIIIACVKSKACTSSAEQLQSGSIKTMQVDIS